MSAIETRQAGGPHARSAGGLRRAAAWLWDVLFGPPRPRYAEDGGASVKLLGRRFEASSPGALFDAVARERQRLVVQLGKMHEGAATRPFIAGTRFSDTYHHQTRRLEDRIGFYSIFLGRLARDLGLD
jgi:hypothetical protein